MDDPMNTIRQTAEDLTHEANGRAKQIGAQVKETWNDVQDRSSRAVTEASTYAKSHPLPTAASCR